MTKACLRTQGFTIVELILVIFITGLLSLSIASMLIKTLQGSNQEFLAAQNVSQAISVATKFTNDLRNATNGSDGSYPVGEAGATQVVFYSNAGDSANVNRIRYYLSGTTLYRGFTAPSGTPLSYNLANEIIRVVQTDVINNPSVIFTYFDGDYTGSESALIQPVNVNNIKYVKMSLTILKQIEKGNQSTFSISAGAAIRNLKNNLGD
jgi:type II secretory pathway pseudopilin PulG